MRRAGDRFGIIVRVEEQVRVDLLPFCTPVQRISGSNNNSHILCTCDR